MSSTPPPTSGSGGPEFLEPESGDPIARSREGRDGRRTALLAGAAAAGLALVGGGVWATMSFLASGPQPAEALPAGTIGYVSIDLDPSGEQKIEAFRMLDKFPALREELDGFDADDDLLELAFEDIEKECDGLDYTEDVKPWLGYRFAVAAVDLGEERPTPVGVVQVTDADAARDGLAKLRECAGEDEGGWVVEGDWAVVAETEDLAREASAAAADGSLADDADFQRWTEEVGDPGVMTMYAGPELGRHLADLAANPLTPLSPLGGMTLDAEPGLAEPDVPVEPEVPEEMAEALESFEGMAATVRFSDGALEFEAVAGGGDVSLDAFAATGAGDAVGALPADTAVAYGLSLPEGWLTAMLDFFREYTGESASVEELLTQFEAQTGVSGDDVEALLGESAALGIGSDFDPEAFFGSADGSGVPIGARITGDSERVQEVLGKLADQAGGAATFLANDADGDVVAVGPNADYRKQLLEDGGLGDTEVFQNVVREADQAGAVFFVNFRAGDWLQNLSSSDPEVAENLERLEGLGASSWIDDQTSHVVFRVTTD
ncbi:DUF3352 domain-containing protein [Nocardioides coralli]|uniref:DUF3352 domain-containing protein n=1 Tax=Nocardioides coralli TaxID=2872154 RepID=UPI001CA43150|nr:DUF3352 domain-containing protein [Nocardioides coralli]QZY27943.1 DUF3352 domain-containing protein [Nocardioides coralli]